MPHERVRHILPHLIKKAKLWPVVGLLGARQTGKSTLLREQVKEQLGAKYLLLDRKSLQISASKAPEHFVRSYSEDLKVPLILDEVQKAADLFDAVKAEVDENRTPGRFIFSGSTEFSIRTGIRESLTGRIGLTHLYPFTVAEILKLPFANPWVKMRGTTRCSPTNLELFFEKGGMPGAFFLRNASERQQYYDGWLDTTCFRDIQQIKNVRLTGSLALDILYKISELECPTLSELKNSLRVDARKIIKHIEGLMALFVIRALSPHRLGSGQSRYYVFDCGLARYLGASVETVRIIWALNECLAQYEYSGLPRPKVEFYQSSRHSFIHFIISDRKTERAVLISDEEAPSEYSLRSLRAFRKKLTTARLFVLAPTRDNVSHQDGISFLPWTGMV